jgi:hypothetical protein
LDELFGNNLCIIECREDLQFSFKTVKKKEPFMMAIITPGKCTINSTSCHYELWASSASHNVIPLFHLLNTKTSYLSTKKLLNDSTTTTTVERKRRLSNDTVTLQVPTNSSVKKKKNNDDDDDDDDDDIGSGGGTLTASFILNNVMDVHGLKALIDEFKIDEYGSIFQLDEKDKRVRMIQSIKENVDGLPVFYLNDRLLHLHITENEGHLVTPTNEEIMEIEKGNVPLYKRQTLYYNSKPLTHIEINEEEGVIYFDPVYYQNSCRRQSLIAY